MVANAEQTRTAIVTVFNPPAVPTGEPPTSIIAMEMMEVVSRRFSCGTLAKPAVLVVTDWKKETCILSKKDNSPIVAGLLNSQIKIKSPPPNTRIAEAVMAILL